MAKSAAYTAEDFAAKMDAFIGYCEGDGIDATDYQMIKYFGISVDELESYRSENIMNNDSIYKTGVCTAALKKLDLYREDATIRQIVSEPKLTSHGAFKLKQLHWGGWGDKQEPSQDLNIRVKIGYGESELLD